MKRRRRSREVDLVKLTREKDKTIGARVHRGARKSKPPPPPLTFPGLVIEIGRKAKLKPWSGLCSGRPKGSGKKQPDGTQIQEAQETPRNAVKNEREDRSGAVQPPKKPINQVKIKKEVEEELEYTGVNIKQEVEN